MLNCIVHRGRDGEGHWINGSVGLGHRMLWTTPESLHEKLPLTNKTRDVVITADARIDNRDDLISALNMSDHLSETITDSEIIMAAYEKWGERSPEKLIGDFSFAIWDNRKNMLFCARDPIGIRPFYYYFDKKPFVGLLSRDHFLKPVKFQESPTFLSSASIFWTGLMSRRRHYIDTYIACPRPIT